MFNSLHEGWAAPEPGADLGIVGPLCAPAKHAPLQWAQHIASGSAGALGFGEAGPLPGSSDRLGAAPDAASDLLLVDALLRQA